MSPQLTASQAVREMRAMGFKLNVPDLMDGIEQGYYPFGRIKRRGATGRRTPEIYRVDFERWIKEKTGGITE